MRDITSQAATNAVSNALPSAFFSSAIAKAGKKSGRARMDARARLAHVVELEGVSHDAVRERGLCRLRRKVFSKNGGTAAQTRSRESNPLTVRLHGFVEP